MELIRKRFIIKKTEVLFSPVQLTPSPEYPGLQVHTKDPLLFLQIAFALQLCFPASHSFISAKKKSSIWNSFTAITVPYHNSHFMRSIFIFKTRWILKSFSVKLILISKGFAPRLVLRQKLETTRKWPIRVIIICLTYYTYLMLWDHC